MHSITSTKENDTMKKIKLLLILTLLFFACTCGTALANDWTIEVNGTPIDAEVKIVEGRSLIPLRAVGEALGLEVNYSDISKYITLKDPNYIDSFASVWLKYNKELDKYTYTAVISGRESREKYKINIENFDMYVQPININGRMYVPVRLVASSFGAPVSVNGTTISIGNIFTDTSYSLNNIKNLIYSENSTLAIPEGSKTNETGNSSSVDYSKSKTVYDDGVMFRIMQGQYQGNYIVFLDDVLSEGKAFMTIEVEEIYAEAIGKIKERLKDPVSAKFDTQISSDYATAFMASASSKYGSVFDYEGAYVLVGTVRAANSYGAYNISSYAVQFDENWNVIGLFL